MTAAEKLGGFGILSMQTIMTIEEKSDQELKIYLAAQEYAKCGFYVLPVTKNWKGLPRKEYNITYSNATKNPKTIEKWFDPYSGIFAGWNIGIAGGKEGGLFIVDVDNHEDKNGFLALEAAIEEFGPMSPGPMQTTPTGGRHYLFQWQEHAANTTDKIGVGIDTRGGTERQCKGHIVAWPSTIDGKMYKWDAGGEVPVAPRWIMERMGVLWRNKKYSTSEKGRGNENVDVGDLEAVLDVDQIKRMLGHIKPDLLSYDEWLKIGMSIKSQYAGEDGLGIWDTWSKTGESYKSNECTARWDGLDPCGAVRAGTLFFVAKEHGWKVDKEAGDKIGNKFDAVVAEMNKEYGIVAIGGKIKILREKAAAEGFGDPFDLMDKDSFKTLMMNDKIWVKSGDKEKPMSTADIWLAHENRRTYPNGMGLYPRMDTPPGYFNTWTGFAVEPQNGTCDLFMEHILKVVCDGDELLNQWLLDWIADLIQQPSEPKGCAVVLRGDEGVGKGTIANIVGELFGPHYKHLIDDSHLTSNFNAHLLDAVVVFADEITWGGNKKTAGKLKGMVTEKNLLGERKGVDAIIYKNMIHMFIASNSEWVIPAGRNSRRWFVLDVPPTKMGDHSYFSSIQDEMENGGKGAFLQQMLNRPVTSNLRVAPETAALETQRSLSATYPTAVMWWSRCILREKIDTPDEREFDPENANTSWPSIVSKDGFYTEYEMWCVARKEYPVHYNMFCMEMKTLGVLQTRPTINKKRVRVFTIPPLDESREILGKHHPTLTSAS